MGASHQIAPLGVVGGGQCPPTRHPVIVTGGWSALAQHDLGRLHEHRHGVASRQCHDVVAHRTSDRGQPRARPRTSGRCSWRIRPQYRQNFWARMRPRSLARCCSCPVRRRASVCWRSVRSCASASASSMPGSCWWRSCVDRASSLQVGASVACVESSRAGDEVPFSNADDVGSDGRLLQPFEVGVAAVAFGVPFVGEASRAMSSTIRASWPARRGGRSDPGVTAGRTGSSVSGGPSARHSPRCATSR